MVKILKSLKVWSKKVQLPKFYFQPTEAVCSCQNYAICYHEMLWERKQQARQFNLNAFISKNPLAPKDVSEPGSFTWDSSSHHFPLPIPCKNSDSRISSHHFPLPILCKKSDSRSDQFLSKSFGKHNISNRTVL